MKTLSAYPVNDTTAIAKPGAMTGWKRVAWVLVPVACHIGFSWIGFSPTDDGWLQAVARRLIEGEVPHRDFIFVRPVLSAVLQIPLVLVGGDLVIWLSRLWGWLTLGLVCWLWTELIAREVSLLLRYVYYIISLLLCAHTFPVMGWHTIDGMLFCTAAVAVLVHDTPGRRRIAFFLAGMAVLCRQNFALFPPLLLIAVGGQPRSWFVAGAWSVLPSVIYISVISALGGAADFFQQFWSTSGSVSLVAIYRYVSDSSFWTGTLSGLLMAAIALFTTRPTLSRAIPPASFLIASLCLSYCLARYQVDYYQATVVSLGAVLSLTVVTVLRGPSRIDRLTLVAALGLAWVSSISFGYNNPGLMSGVLLLAGSRLLQILFQAPTDSRYCAPTIMVAAVAVCVAFTYARHQFPFRDQPAAKLAYDAGLVLKGASGLRTNKLTFDTLRDLEQLIERLTAEKREFALLTDCSAIWIRNSTKNPLPCEWPQETELGYSAVLVGRVISAIANLPPNSCVIVQKLLIADYAWEATRVPTDSKYYYVQNWVASRSPKLIETRFFTVYSPNASLPLGIRDSLKAKEDSVTRPFRGTTTNKQ